MESTPERPRLTSFESSSAEDGAASRGDSVRDLASGHSRRDSKGASGESPISWEDLVADMESSPNSRRQVSHGVRTASPTSIRSFERLDSKGSVGRGRRGSQVVGAEFVKSKSNFPDQTEGDYYTCLGCIRTTAERFQTSKYVSNFMVVAVLFDAYCTCSDIDARAAGEPPPTFVMLMSDLCLLLYTFELIMAAISNGLVQVLQDWTVVVDVVIIACGYTELLLNTLISGDAIANLGVLRALRLARIVRLMRLLRRTRALRELQKLVHMMDSCLKALLWSFVFCFLIMTVWAMFMVEIVHPLIQEMVQRNHFQDCEQCVRATASVMDANLLLFKTVIAGDSWGLIAVPVIENYPATAVIFVGSLLTLVFGVLNLIVAVVVDTFAEARQRDILNLAEELEYDSEKDKRFLQRIFDRMDMSGTGQVTFEELLDGARRDTEFQSRLRVMDIDENDLHLLFEMIDTSSQGSIKSDEFIAPLSRWVHDSKTAPRFIKYNLMRALEQQEELYVFCQDYFNNLGSRMDFLAHALQRMYENSTMGSSFAARAPGPQAGTDASPGVEPTQSNADLEECVSESSRHTEADEVEQPHKSRRAVLKVDPNHVVKNAMETLESCVLKATERALKSSLADVESTIRDQLHATIPEISPVKPLKSSFPRLSEFQRQQQALHRNSTNSSGSAMTSIATTSFALGATTRERSHPRRPVGTFSPPGAPKPKKERSGSKPSTEDASDSPSPPSRRIGSKQSRDDLRHRIPPRDLNGSPGGLSSQS